MLSYIEIKKEYLLHNIRTLRSVLVPKTAIMSVVKGNAYGHGLVQVASVLENDTDYFGVISIEDLRVIRTVTKKPVLVLGYISKNDLKEAISLDGILSIYDVERVRLLNELGKRMKKHPRVHLKIDAALGRQGVLTHELADFMDRIADYTQVSIEGVYAHFANIEDTTDFSHAQKQITEFESAKTIMHEHGYTELMSHISSTAGTLVYERKDHTHAMVRLGIGLYGMWPSSYIADACRAEGLELKPVMRWISHLAQVKKVPAGFSIGYGLTFSTPKAMTIAVVPQGYSDGYDRGLSSIGTVLVRGRRCPVLGRVAMNMFVIDVTHIPSVRTEDEVVLLGDQGDERISAEEIASQLGTINYEITTRVSSLLPRRIV